MRNSSWINAGPALINAEYYKTMRPLMAARLSISVHDLSRITLRFHNRPNFHRSHPYVNNVGKTKGWWRKYHYAIQNHHIFFKCLGGSDEAANMLSMRMMIHQGQDVGLQWNLVRHMNAKNYKELGDMWFLGSKTEKADFLMRLREGYSNYFVGSPDYDEIMKLVDSALGNITKGID